MALIQCPECQGEVSDQAASCPHCGYPLQRAVSPQPKATPSAPSLDDTLRQMLIQGNKIAAIKLYRDHYPGASLSVAKDYVDRLQAAMPASLGNSAKGGSCLLLVCLGLALVPSLAFWSHTHRLPTVQTPVPPLSARR